MTLLGKKLCAGKKGTATVKRLNVGMISLTAVKLTNFRKVQLIQKAFLKPETFIINFWWMTSNPNKLSGKHYLRSAYYKLDFPDTAQSSVQYSPSFFHFFL